MHIIPLFATSHTVFGGQHLLPFRRADELDLEAAAVGGLAMAGIVEVVEDNFARGCRQCQYTEWVCVGIARQASRYTELGHVGIPTLPLSVDRPNPSR